MSQIDISTKFHTTDKYLPPKERISREWLTDAPQRYSGEILNNNIHGNGFYFIQNEDKLFYDGLFYANKLEGYSEIFYGDSSYFQGLFRDHKRLGPGVLTYSTGEQDVGLWDGFSLARLETLVEPNVVPMLGNSTAGKVKLVKYRYLVPVCPKDRDLAVEVLTDLKANDRVLDESHKLYNVEVENMNNLFFHKRMFDEKFYTTQDCLIDILAPEEETEEATEIKDEVEDEEECIKGSSTDAGRIRQISDELELIECKLDSTRRMLYIVNKKVEYCRFCCYGDQGEENVSPSEHEDYDDLVTEDISSYTTMLNYDDTLNNPSEYIRGDSTFKIEDYLIDQCDCQEAIHIDDLASLEKQLEAIKKDEKFYETIIRRLQEKLKYHLKKSEMCAAVKTQQVLVNDLLAWNNEELSMRMLKHSFLHRRSEYMVDFNVSTLLKGKRDQFSAPGLHEINSIAFLLNCTRGGVKTLLDTIRINNINVNLCDTRGNSGIFFAAANGRTEVIPVLVNFGAKLDQVNDEGLTPLLICLLIYLSLHHERFDWDSSFLPEFNPLLEIQPDLLPNWYQSRSPPSLNNDAQSLMRSSQGTVNMTRPACDNRLLRMRVQKTDSELAMKEPYLFVTPFVDYKEPKKAKAKPTKKPVEEPARSPDMELKEEAKRLTTTTINALLKYGANPNVGDVPLPNLILGVFSESECLVRYMLEAVADVNVSMTDCMTGLHIVASLRCAQENVDICRTLLEFGADANLRTSTNHWAERKIVILGKNVKPDTCEDLGKNPLHILCIRKDFPLDTCNFFSSLATMMIEHEIRPNDMYLGHTALSLAVLTGNINLVETLLKLKPVATDPHLLLGNNMGNVLTLYILKRYNNVLPLEKSMEMMKLLVDLNVNPLIPVGEFENAIEFMEKEHEVIKVDKKKGGKKESKGSKKSDSSKKKGKTPPQDVLKEYLKELARDMIIRYAQFEAVEHLYDLAEGNMLDFDFTKTLAEFLTPTITLEILTVLFNRGRIKYARFNKDICLKVVEFVEKYQKVIKTKKGGKDKKDKGKTDKKDKKSSKGSSSKSSTTQETVSEPPPPTYSEIIDATNFEKVVKKKSIIKLHRPGLDDTSKYVVCFHCLRRSNKLLVLCPRCQYVYYCSEQCNKLNVKMKAQHNCTINYYKAQKQRLESGDISAFPENVSEICKIASQKCEAMLIRKHEEEIEQLRRQDEEENRLDIYGTRFLKSRQENRRISLKSYMTIGTVSTSIGTGMSLTEKNGEPLEKMLIRMSLREEKYVDMMSKRHESSMKGSAQVEFREAVTKKKIKKKPSCKCMLEDLVEKKEDEPSKAAVAAVKGAATKKIHKEGVVSKFEATDVIAEPDQIIRKLRRIPSKYQYFIELLSTYFPDVDLSYLFLPYACYCNGHLYYKFLDDNIYSKTYSMV